MLTRLRTVFAFIILVVLSSGCATVHKNGYYQTRKYSFGKDQSQGQSQKKRYHHDNIRARIISETIREQAEGASSEEISRKEKVRVKAENDNPRQSGIRFKKIKEKRFPQKADHITIRRSGPSKVKTSNFNRSSEEQKTAEDDPDPEDKDMVPYIRLVLVFAVITLVLLAIGLSGISLGFLNLFALYFLITLLGFGLVIMEDLYPNFSFILGISILLIGLFFAIVGLVSIVGFPLFLLGGILTMIGITILLLAIGLKITENLEPPFDLVLSALIPTIVVGIILYVVVQFILGIVFLILFF